ncbi:hedgehog signaling/DD-peptidase zinc-bindingdomain protein [Vibrio phage 417E50-1]|nr:hedgehog signaling/DD-peptidase zinc-bindingdomain protein [Vibrio phage 417E50-1]
MATLGQKQKMFVRMIADLIMFAYEQGYELTFGDTFRDPRVHGKFGNKIGYSAARSVHKLKLACDFNLFVKDVYIQTSNHKAWDELHEYWESIGGAKRIPNDVNHFSVEHEGRR